jgi:hypothetical protein
MAQEHCWGLVDQYLFRFVVQCQAGVYILFNPCAFYQCVVCRAIIMGMVLGCAFIEQGIQEIFWVGVICTPPLV